MRVRGHFERVVAADVVRGFEATVTRDNEERRRAEAEARAKAEAEALAKANDRADRLQHKLDELDAAAIKAAAEMR